MTKQTKKITAAAMAPFKFLNNNPAPSSSAAQSSSDDPPVVATSSDSVEPADNTLLVANADAAIKDGGLKFYEYYNAYKKLREIAKPLNGLPSSAPIPGSISIDKITVHFTKNGETQTVEIYEPQKISDIAGLISFAVRDVVEKMHNELHVLSQLVSSMNAAVQKAFTAKVMQPPPGNYDNTNTVQ